jgi:hypothetical protein
MSADTAKDRTQVLCHEYDTLRTEAIHRTNNMYQFLTVAAALLVWLASNARLSLGFCSLFLFFFLIVFSFGLIIYHDVERIGRRLRQLERQINDLAGEPLLKWETYWSRAVTGWVIGVAPLSSVGNDHDN